MRKPILRVVVPLAGLISGMVIPYAMFGEPRPSAALLLFVFGGAVIVWGVLVLQQEIVAVRRELVDVNGRLFMLYKKMAEPDKFFRLTNEYKGKFHPDHFFVEEDVSPAEWERRRETLQSRIGHQLDTEKSQQAPTND